MIENVHCISQKVQVTARLNVPVTYSWSWRQTGLNPLGRYHQNNFQPITSNTNRPAIFLDPIKFLIDCFFFILLLQELILLSSVACLTTIKFKLIMECRFE